MYFECKIPKPLIVSVFFAFILLIDESRKPLEWSRTHSTTIMGVRPNQSINGTVCEKSDWLMPHQ